VATPDQVLAAVRRHALALPEATERLSHGSPAFFVRRAPQFAAFVNNHHGDGNIGIWCAAPPGVQAELVETEPDRFFVPAYVGHRGWIGVRLDTVLDEVELAAILEDAYRTVAPAGLVARLDGR
jgi:hypothetical protein